MTIRTNPARGDAWVLPQIRLPAGARSLIQPYDLASGVLIAALVLVVGLTVRQYGISNDEEVQHRYGELIVAYYTSGFEDRTLFSYKNLYLYGGLFDIIAVLLGRIIPADVYLIRHVLCALIGVAGVAATWATARAVGGPRAGFIAALALAVTAQWHGAMFNHTKDVPFAAAMIGATYFLLRAGRDLPHPHWRDTLGFGLLLGAACGLRAMGLLLIGYLGLIVLVHLVRLRSSGAEAARSAGLAALRLLPGLLLGYAIMLAAWPWAALHPLNPLRAIFAFSHFHYEIRTIFAGTIYEMADVPRWYVPAYLAIRLPLLMLGGAALTAILFWSKAFGAVPGSGQTRLEVALLWCTVLVPVTCQVIGDGPAFTGMRHFFFVVPPLAVLAGVGLDTSMRWLAARHHAIALAAAAALSAAVIWETGLMVQLHPYQYLYYNALVGGLPGAAGQFAMDYWVNIMPEAVARLEAFLDLKGVDSHDVDPPVRPYTVAVCGERLSFEREADARLQWTAGWYEADFFIAPTHMGCDRRTNGAVIATIERLGVVIGVVKYRRGFMPPHLIKAR